jgi:hypothetical protein
MREIDGIKRFVTNTPLLVTVEIISPLLLKQQCVYFTRKGDCCNAICRGKPAFRFVFHLRQIVCYIKYDVGRSLLADVAAFPSPN